MIHTILVSVMLGGGAVVLLPAASESSSAAVASRPAKTKAFPFQGKVAAVDIEAKTITLQGKEKNRTFLITNQTRIMKDGKAASLADAKVGDAVGGQALAAGESTYEALSLRIGAKPSKNAPQSATETMK
jgi:hypothetical protein